MKLSAYLVEKNISDADFAASIDVTRQAVHRYKTGERVPEWPVLARIKLATDGAVLPDDFLDAPAPADQPAEAAG